MFYQTLKTVWRGKSAAGLPPNLCKCGGSAQAPFFTGGFIPAFARCCFCIARRVLAGPCGRFAARPSASANLTTSLQAHLPTGREPPQGYPPTEGSREASSMRGADIPVFWFSQVPQVFPLLRVVYQICHATRRGTCHFTFSSVKHIQ